MLKSILKAFGVALVALLVVFAWHFGTAMDPAEQNNAALSCVLSAQVKTGDRGQEILRAHVSKLFREEKAWVQVLNKERGTKSEIFCRSLSGQLRLLYVDGKQFEL